jgi:hypothetical protein
MPEQGDPKRKAFRSQRMMSERLGIAFTFDEWPACGRSTPDGSAEPGSLS